MKYRPITAAVQPVSTLSPNRLLDLASIRRLEQRWLQETPAGTLMAAAGAAVASVALKLWRRLPADTTVLLLVGPGNNGGDALVAGRHLIEAGLNVQAAVFSGLEDSPPSAADARAAWVAWRAAGHGFMPLVDAERLLQQPVLIIDGLFGIGMSRPLAGQLARLARAIDVAGVPVLAIDVPSGLDADTGAAVGGGPIIRADHTVTMIADKPGLHTGAGPAHAGTIWLAALDEETVEFGHADNHPLLLDTSWARACLPQRKVDAHKGSAGDLLILGGRLGMAGAARLAATGALAAGAGRIWIGTEDDDGTHAGPIAPEHPEIMRFALHSPRQLPGKDPVLLIGCGLGQDTTARQWLRQALGSQAPLVLDADALNLMAGMSGLPSLPVSVSDDGEAARGEDHDEATEPGGAQAAARAPDNHHGAEQSLFSVSLFADAPRRGDRRGARQPRPALRILTPHPVEAARLLNISLSEVQADRIGCARALARRFDAVVVLKGVGTVIARPDGQYRINGSGHPVLATAGTGDVLAGTIGALLAMLLRAQTEPRQAAWQAACLGAWLHGHAGQQLARQQGPQGVGASQLPSSYPGIFRVLGKQSL